MAKKDKSFNSCLLILGLFASLVIIVLWASMDTIQDKLKLEDPDSEVGKKIDSMIPQMEAKAQYDHAKLTMQNVHMKGIKDLFVMDYIQTERRPQSLEELVGRRVLSRKEMYDLWQHRQRFIPTQQEIYLVSGGPDRIMNTEDDIIITLMDPHLLAPEEDRSLVISLISEQILQDKVLLDPHRKENNDSKAGTTNPDS